MRVITGIAKGRHLQTLDSDYIRPTSDKVKEAIFDSIQFDIEGRTCLDLFAGTGALGIEALSRGAEKVVFVDISKDSVGVVNKNLQHCGLDENAVVKLGDGVSFLKTTDEKFDIAFLDPPYNKGIVSSCLPYVPNIMNEGGIIVCETSADEDLPLSFGKFIQVKNSKYSKTRLIIYRYSQD